MQTFYTVQSGDTLSTIANRFGVSIASIVAANNLSNPDQLFIGMQLSIPPGVNRYRVQSGDTLYLIASRFNIPLTTLIQANNLQAPYTIFPGQLLEVPPGVPYYIVQPGDSLYSIGLRYNVTTAGKVNVKLIQNVNQLASTTIYPGMRLIIPYAPLGEDGIIAYIAGESNRFDVWLYDVANGNTHQLTNGLAESFSIPFWSPDSERIAFVGRDYIIYIIEVTTGNITRIDQLSEQDGAFLDWSPNGRRLAYTKGNTIYLYDISSHTIQTITQTDATDVQWFPDGYHLLFQAPDENGISQLYRIRINGTNLTQLTTNTGGRLNYVRLSPDGRYALYTSPGVSVSIIYIVDLSTSEVREVQGGPLGKNYFPDWRQDSNLIAFSATAFEELGYHSLIRTTTNQGTDEMTVAISNCFTAPLDWSPDGAKIAYISGCNVDTPGTELWLVNIQDYTVRKLLTHPNIMAVQWAPVVKGKRATYQNTMYQIRLQYPASWVQVTPNRFEGTDGFFQVDAISSPGSIESVCHNEAFHQLMPYGTNPTILHTSIHNQEGCYIFPSPDQIPEMENQAAFIVRFPNPILINDQVYQYFILWSNELHIRDIAESIEFI
ncbi:LysM peptidoglycan-binding domain-containing protein [Ornithinibacillus sp. 179-J 7C1 HS]|uniref:LysM peptidoglycan-binding domain-containing protein n=1 Tax=Ornithinibacillus sp. 179-J 7C1 HS TaxID=3142384 RepID=UPI0039A3ADE5